LSELSHARTDPHRVQLGVQREHEERVPDGTAMLDGLLPSRRALWLLRREQCCWENVIVRTSRYLYNLVEQDHRAIKRRRASMADFKSFDTAVVTIAGIELAH
jgi:transposase-like protein